MDETTSSPYSRTSPSRCELRMDCSKCKTVFPMGRIVAPPGRVIEAAEEIGKALGPLECIKCGALAVGFNMVDKPFPENGGALVDHVWEEKEEEEEEETE